MPVWRPLPNITGEATGLIACMVDPGLRREIQSAVLSDFGAMTQEELRVGEEIARCPSCSLYITVIYDPVSPCCYNGGLLDQDNTLTGGVAKSFVEVYRNMLCIRLEIWDWSLGLRNLTCLRGSKR